MKVLSNAQGFWKPRFIGNRIPKRNCRLRVLFYISLGKFVELPKAAICPPARSKSRFSESRKKRSAAKVGLKIQHLRYLLDVFITTTGEVDDDDLVPPHLGSHFNGFGDGVSGFQGGDDALGFTQVTEGV